jgi:hypothetical protein
MGKPSRRAGHLVDQGARILGDVSDTELRSPDAFVPLGATIYYSDIRNLLPANPQPDLHAIESNRQAGRQR